MEMTLIHCGTHIDYRAMNEVFFLEYEVRQDGRFVSKNLEHYETFDGYRSALARVLGNSTPVGLSKFV